MPAAMMSDPLGAFREGARIKGSDHPMPLAATRIAVQLAGRLALVSTERVFRNDEARSIEATITFPVPVSAVLTGLEAAIDGRRLVARCQRRAAARETYEAAIDAGKTSVLHEELLKGVHMLSVGHIPPGAEIIVTSNWVAPLAAHGDEAVLRIPTTVGEIYGRSPLADSDDLVTGPLMHEADLAVTADGATVRLTGAALVDGKARVRLNQPIELRVAGIGDAAIAGRAADGRLVILEIAPAPAGEADLDLELLLDESGSMDEDCGGTSKWQALLGAVEAAGRTLQPADRVSVTLFANAPRRVGETVGPALAALPRRIQRIGGGTEIGRALDAATQDGGGRDVVLITDGKSHAVDVQAIARRGRRVSCVLIGADSLDAYAGHLASLTGGDLLASDGADIADCLARVLGGLRVSPVRQDEPDRISVRRGGMAIAARWSEGEAPVGDLARAVGAFAASLILAGLDSEAAATLAEAEGIVCHLTSLVLVDEAGATQETLPAQRKIPLSAPASSMMLHRKRSMVAGGAAAPPMPVMAAPSPAMSESAFAESTPIPAPSEPAPKSSPSFLRRLFAGGPRPPQTPPRAGLLSLAQRIDWSADPEALRQGDLSSLPRDLAAAIRQAASDPAVAALARAIAADPVAVVLALLADSLGSGHRNAARLARSMLGGADRALIAAAIAALRP